MKNSRSLFLFLAIFTLAGNSLLAQEENPFEFGNIAPEWLEDELFESFSEHDVLILYDFSAVSFDVMLSSTPKIQYYFHRRIKILSEKGKKWAEVNIPVATSNPDGETLSELKGATYSLNAVGDVVSFKINRRKIKETKTDADQREISFSLPLVKVGSIIEYSYVINSKNFRNLKKWEFQRSAPIIRSEYHTIIPDRYKYFRLIQGGGFNIVHHQKRFQSMNTGNIFGQNAIGGNNRSLSQPQAFRVNFGGNEDVYILDDVPALVKESFSPESSRFIPSIRLELTENASVLGSQATVFDSWEGLNNSLDKKLKVKKKNYHKWIRSQANQLTRNVNGNKNKAIAIYEYVRDQFLWNGNYEVEFEDYHQVTSGKGSSSSGVNLAMMHLLQAAGVKARPVLISTLDHGIVQTIYPVLSQFNHLLISVEVNNAEILLDGVGEKTTFGILPKNDLNEYGFMIEEEGGRWVKLRSQNRIVKVTYSRFNLDTIGTLNGEIFVKNEDYGAVLERDKYAQYLDEPQTYLKDHILVGMKHPQIIKSEFTNASEEGSPLIIDLELSTKDFVEVVGDLVFIKPMLSKMVTENPLKNENRATPIDFTYPLRDAHMMGLRIPKEYEIVQLPQPIKVLLPNNGGTFIYNVIEMDHIVHLSSTILLEKTTFTPQEYQGIRDFFEYVVNKHQEDIVLKKIGS
ncbi:MAG: DUF3857 domain-containing protein [Bacteroidetes bacterium]|nr:DUF3857 domain-containing protein [Bacteroidota bacterium]MCB0842178.1 DUF3857 domain-containing protein [Bacteroidota bacterium]